jgi:hypothetical protein
MYQVDVTIEGVAPYLYGKWTKEGKKSLGEGIGGGKKSTSDREQEALEKVCRNSNGLYLPGQDIEACLVQGVKMANLKEGRSSAAPYVEATVLVKQREIEFGKQEPDFMHEALGRRPPKRGGACIILRPGLNEGWQLSFTFIVADDRRSPDQLRRGLEEAGLLAGLGEWRPKYGRFVVKKWEVKK